MKVIAFNGGPRKKWNTATLLEKALEGAASKGAKTELINLYDLEFKGCVSCLACKTIGGRSYGKCAMRDALKPVLEKVADADAIILGSPIYFGSVTGEMRSFMERLLFPYLAYTDPPQSLFPKKIKTGLVYTMNVTEDDMQKRGYVQHLDIMKMVMGLVFGSVETLYCFDTLQVDDYSKILSTRFDPVKKAARRKDVFPEDCRKAFDMGVRLTD
jgi:multimeric flavodoxin WrbA